MLFWYSGKEISDSNDELITDVEDETGEAITLPVVGTNKPTNERELLHFLDEDFNEVSVTIMFLILESFFTNRLYIITLTVYTVMLTYFIIVAQNT